MSQVVKRFKKIVIKKIVIVEKDCDNWKRCDDKKGCDNWKRLWLKKFMLAIR